MIYLNDDPINVTLFPDNTSQVWKLDEKHLSQERATVVWDFTHESEIFHIVQLKHLLDTYGVDRVYLHVDYLPFGRQDKAFNNNTTFALRSFATILNNLHFNEVFIMDPHSIIALGLIKKSTAIYPQAALLKAIKATDSDMICYPDNGALTKYVGIYKNDLPYIYGEKVRDQATGHILNYELFGDPLHKRVLIVDDICDGGKTFELLSNDLYDAGANSISLFVTHGLFTKGLRPLKQAKISRIFTNKGEAIQMPDDGFGFRKVLT